MTPAEELRARFETLAFVEEKPKKKSSDEGDFSKAHPDAGKAGAGNLAHFNELEAEKQEIEDYLEQQFVAESQGAFYSDCLEARDYVAELGDPRSAITDLAAIYGSVGIAQDELADHPATQIAQALSDEMNSGRNFY